VFSLAAEENVGWLWSSSRRLCVFDDVYALDGMVGGSLAMVVDGDLGCRLCVDVRLWLKVAESMLAGKGGSFATVCW